MVAEPEPVFATDFAAEASPFALIPVPEPPPEKFFIAMCLFDSFCFGVVVQFI